MNTIGVIGGRWRATVTEAGDVEPWDGSPPLRWWIAADDRWHSPSVEPGVRQRRLDGVPVYETRLRVPGGDAVQRVWASADRGGMTVVEVENASSLPFAVAFSRRDLMSARPPTDVPIQGIELPATSVVFPVGHQASVRIAVAHHEPTAGPLPERVAEADAVVRGWIAAADRAGRVDAPEGALTELLRGLRADIALVGPADPNEQPASFLLAVAQLVRMGEPAQPWVVDVAEAASMVARGGSTWVDTAALDAAAIVLAHAAETRAVADVQRMRTASTPRLPISVSTTEPVAVLAWHEQRLVRAGSAGAAELLAAGLPSSWWGQSLDVRGLPSGPHSTVSYALRWHGERPAVLWEQTGPALSLHAPIAAPGWSTTAAGGEALWPAPAS